MNLRVTSCLGASELPSGLGARQSSGVFHRAVSPPKAPEGWRTPRRYRTRRACSESGSLLIIVLWIAFGLVALTLYFAHSMNLELRAADNRVAAVEAGQAVEGAARYLSNILATVAYPGYPPDPIDYWMEAVPVGDATFWLIGRDTNDWEINLTTPAFGLVDEASKINLNASWLSAEMIEYLPGMTPQIAAAIMDWRDEDTTISTDGAEDETYSKLVEPYKAKNAAFESVEELRLVAGMTAEILYGEDANLNGILDANENDGDLSPPNDNRDGRLDPGLMEYFTVYSREPATGTNVHNRADVRVLLESTLGTSRADDVLRESGLAATNAFATITSLLDFYIRSGLTEDEFGQVADYLSATTNSFTEGLINVNTAKQPVLECIPGLTNYAAELISYRELNPTKLNSVAWVVNVVDDTDALAAGPYITTHSYQFTADVAAVGHHGRGHQRVRFVFDTSEGLPTIIRRQDLTHLGWALGKEIRTELFAAKETR